MIYGLLLYTTYLLMKNVNRLHLCDKIGCVAIITALLFGCNPTPPGMALTKKVQVNEDSITIHHTPFVFNILTDSTVGFVAKPLCYSIYNIHTGAMCGRLTIDSINFVKGLNIAIQTDGKDYMLTTQKDVIMYGMPPVQIYNAFSEPNSGIIYLFYTQPMKVNDTVVINGKKETGIGVKPMVFFDVFDHSICKNKPVYVKSNRSIFASPITGIGKLGARFFMQNNGANKNYLVAAVDKLSDSVYSVCDSLIPADKQATANGKKRKLQMITFPHTEKQDLAFSNGFAIYDSHGKELLRSDTTTDNGQIISFSISGDIVLYQTIKFAQDKNSSSISKVMKYDITNKQKNLLLQIDGAATGTFTANNEFVCICKENKNYYFKTYTLK